ncbi:hypothetical protein ABB37_08588 [Leptomonas pyrrhocoris]|uniref:Uncharacterized protein n=1 Tax=Leptomonas pyrrhocoris TaxID=157538 RepID=A0A0M9FSU9_LEPPY|nr:hypothetical protein ABB37_08588 [Leptomonas pyrrhocoris]KPA75287.1 hypothetical protein ABB37_08588 [Leptomonas pyrrhocoris]|eukprot:XP_015653726.1 hypothetical protein ABB37_08588 [Leptomonas pyrrhocoris]
MAIKGSGAVLMEPLSSGRCPMTGVGPSMNYLYPSRANNTLQLPPVPQCHAPNSGAWQGGPMPASPMNTQVVLSGSPRPGSSFSSPARMMRGGGGKAEFIGSPMLPTHPMPPHPPQTLNFPIRSPRQMLPGAPTRSLVGPPPGVPHEQHRTHNGFTHTYVPPVDVSSMDTSTSSAPVAGPRKAGAQRPFIAPLSQQPPPGRRSLHVRSVARGPQPTSTDPTRLRDGRKIKDVQRQQQQQQQQGQGSPVGGPHRFTGPGKNGLAAKQNNNTNRNNNNHSEPKPIKTTVDNDESWVKGLTNSIWIDSPRGNLNDLDAKEGSYKRQGGHANRRRRQQKSDSTSSSTSGGVMEMLRSLFR